LRLCGEDGIKLTGQGSSVVVNPRCEMIGYFSRASIEKPSASRIFLSRRSASI
jgi:hypothetical protein